MTPSCAAVKAAYLTTASPSKGAAEATPVWGFRVCRAATNVVCTPLPKASLGARLVFRAREGGAAAEGMLAPEVVSGRRSGRRLGCRASMESGVIGATKPRGVHSCLNQILPDADLHLHSGVGEKPLHYTAAFEESVPSGLEYSGRRLMRRRSRTGSPRCGVAVAAAAAPQPRRGWCLWKPLRRRDACPCCRRGPCRRSRHGTWAQLPPVAGAVSSQGRPLRNAGECKLAVPWRT
jgi:hypothetical protein